MPVAAGAPAVGLEPQFGFFWAESLVEPQAERAAGCPEPALVALALRTLERLEESGLEERLRQAGGHRADGRYAGEKRADRRDLPSGTGAEEAPSYPRRSRAGVRLCRPLVGIPPARLQQAAGSYGGSLPRRSQLGEESSGTAGYLECTGRPVLLAPPIWTPFLLLRGCPAVTVLSLVAQHQRGEGPEDHRPAFLPL